LNHKAIDS